MRVRSWGLPRNRGWTGSIGLVGDMKAREGIAWPNTGRCIPTRLRAGQRCAETGTRGCGLGIMLSTMRRPLVAGGAGDYCPPKLVSPALHACLSHTHTHCSVCRVPFRGVQHVSARRPPQGSGACPHVRVASVLRLGSVRIVASACVRWCYRTIVYESHTRQSAP